MLESGVFDAIKATSKCISVDAEKPHTRRRHPKILPILVFYDGIYARKIVATAARRRRKVVPVPSARLAVEIHKTALIAARPKPSVAVFAKCKRHFGNYRAGLIAVIMLDEFVIGIQQIKTIIVGAYIYIIVAIGIHRNHTATAYDIALAGDTTDVIKEIATALHHKHTTLKTAKPKIAVAVAHDVVYLELMIVGKGKIKIADRPRAVVLMDKPFDTVTVGTHKDGIIDIHAKTRNHHIILRLGDYLAILGRRIGVIYKHTSMRCAKQQSAVAGTGDGCSRLLVRKRNYLNLFKGQIEFFNNIVARHPYIAGIILVNAPDAAQTYTSVSE